MVSSPLSAFTYFFPPSFLPVCVGCSSHTVILLSCLPAPETEFTPWQLELNSSKSWEVAVLENDVFQQVPTGCGAAPGSSGSSRHFSMGSSWWYSCVGWGRGGRQEWRLLMGRGCTPLPVPGPQALSKRDRLKHRTWKFSQYFRQLKNRYRIISLLSLWMMQLEKKIIRKFSVPDFKCVSLFQVSQGGVTFRHCSYVAITLNIIVPCH